MSWKSIETLPLNDKEVLIRTTYGIVSAWYDAAEGQWVCYDDKFIVETHAIEAWMPIPGEPNQ